MPGASIALRRAVLAQLRATPAVTDLLGGPFIHDDPPRGLKPPYVLLGEATTSDAGTTQYPGAEHRLTLSVWSEQPGASQAFAIADAVVAAVEAMPASLDGHRLVNIAALATELRRERDGRQTRITVRLRAVTESF